MEVGAMGVEAAEEEMHTAAEEDKGRTDEKDRRAVKGGGGRVDMGVQTKAGCGRGGGKGGCGGERGDGDSDVKGRCWRG